MLGSKDENVEPMKDEDRTSSKTMIRIGAKVDKRTDSTHKKPESELPGLKQRRRKTKTMKQLLKRMRTGEHTCHLDQRPQLAVSRVVCNE